jgi:hypothetical protein
MLGMQAGLAEDMLPIDIVDFMHVVSTLKGDLVLCLLVASLKEPLAVAKFLELAKAGENPLLCRRDYTGEELGKMLEEVAVCLHGCPNKTEVQKLIRQGVARFVGPASTLVNLGVIVMATSMEKEKHKGGQDDGEARMPPRKKRKGTKGAADETDIVVSQGCGPPTPKLGITQREYTLTHDYTALQKFIEACRCSGVQQVCCVMYPSRAMILTPSYKDEYTNLSGSCQCLL